MTFYAFFNKFTLLQLNYDNKLSGSLPGGYKSIHSKVYNDDFDVVTFSNESGLIRTPEHPRIPAVNGDFIYFFPLAETRPVGVVYDNGVFDLKFKLHRATVKLWLEAKDVQRRDFVIPEVFNVLLITECHRKYKDGSGVVLWCK